MSNHMRIHRYCHMHKNILEKIYPRPPSARCITLMYPSVSDALVIAAADSATDPRRDSAAEEPRVAAAALAAYACPSPQYLVRQPFG